MRKLYRIIIREAIIEGIKFSFSQAKVVGIMISGGISSIIKFLLAIDINWWWVLVIFIMSFAFG